MYKVANVQGSLSSACLTFVCSKLWTNVFLIFNSSNTVLGPVLGHYMPGNQGTQSHIMYMYKDHKVKDLCEYVYNQGTISCLTKGGCHNN